MSTCPKLILDIYITAYPLFFYRLYKMSLFLSLQVSKIAAYAYSAISQIKVDAKEELVVQFAIP